MSALRVAVPSRIIPVTLKIGTVVATQPDAWGFRVRASSSSSSSSAFPAISVGFTIFSKIFVYVTIFLIQP